MRDDVLGGNGNDTGNGNGNCKGSSGMLPVYNGTDWVSPTLHIACDYNFQAALTIPLNLLTNIFQQMHFLQWLRLHVSEGFTQKIGLLI